MAEDVNVQYLDQKPYAAKYDRQFFRDILTEGIIKTDDLKITELDTPGMGVKVAKGRALVQGDQSEWQGHYGIKNDASKNLTIAASDPTNPRKDRVVAQVYDSIDIGGAQDKWALEVLTGTPAASPVPPALPDDALDLAIIDVGAGVTEILNANITDQRERIGFQNVSEKGWLSAGETWTYASATTITVLAGALLKYQKGDKIKLTQTTVKYFYVIGVADTVLTITGGTDYTLADAAITSPYYSKVENPQGFPTLFNWTPTYSASGSMTYTSVVTSFAYFKIAGNVCEIMLRAAGTTGGTASTSLHATLPVNNIDDFGVLACDTRDAATTVGYAYYDETNKIVTRKYDASNYGLGADRQIVVNGSYKI